MVCIFFMIFFLQRSFERICLLACLFFFSFLISISRLQQHRPSRNQILRSLSKPIISRARLQIYGFVVYDFFCFIFGFVCFLYDYLLPLNLQLFLFLFLTLFCLLRLQPDCIFSSKASAARGPVPRAVASI